MNLLSCIIHKYVLSRDAFFLFISYFLLCILGNGSGFNILVRFLPSFVSGSGSFLNFDILEVQNKSGKLNDYMKSSFDRIFSFPRDYNFNLIYSAIDNVSLTGSPAYQFEYFNTAPYDPSKLIKVMVIGTIIDNTNYEVSYAADLYSYSRYLESATKMIYSLQINSTTSITA